MAKANSNRDFYVYAHKRRSDGTTFYIGKGHGNRAFDKSCRNKHWQHTVAKHGYTVEIVQSGMQEWWAFELEIELIALHGRRDTGHGSLVNLSDGGDGSTGHIPSQEFREMASALYKGRKLSIETRTKMSEFQRTRKHTDATKKLMSENAKNRSKEHLMKIGLASKGRKKSPGAIAKFILARTGTKHSESHKKAISGALKKSAKRVSVTCLENGSEFASLLDAIDWLKSQGHLKASSSAINYAMKSNKRTAYGFHWAGK